MTIRKDSHGLEVQASRPSGTVQNLTVGAASVASAAFQLNREAPLRQNDGTTITRPAAPQNTTHVRIVSTTNCWIKFGVAPVAVVGGTGGSTYLPANAPEYFWVVPGEQVAVIQDTVAGVLNISELAN